MVKAQVMQPNRLILFLQQSSVEWCSSLWMHIIAEVRGMHGLSRIQLPKPVLSQQSVVLRFRGTY